MGRGEARVQTPRRFEFLYRGCLIAARLEDRGHLVVGDGFIRHELGHAFELRQGGVQVSLLLERHSQVEPRVRQFRVDLLHLLQLFDAVGHVARAEQCQPVVDAFADRARGQGQRLLELVNCLLLGGRILVEGLTQITVVPQLALVRTRRLGKQHPGQPAGRQCGNQNEAAVETSVGHTL